MMHDDKYIVFKREDFNRLLDFVPAHIHEGEIPFVEDAVVIRRQDVFAPPALDAYANSIMASIEVLRYGEAYNVFLIDRLQAIADYFHQQAQLSWDANRKLPD